MQHISGCESAFEDSSSIAENTFAFLDNTALVTSQRNIIEAENIFYKHVIV